MMNLLISIVSDTFNLMQGRADITLYKEFTELIVDSYQMAVDSQGRENQGLEGARSSYLCVTEVEAARLDHR